MRYQVLKAYFCALIFVVCPEHVIHSSLLSRFCGLIFRFGALRNENKAQQKMSCYIVGMHIDSPRTVIVTLPTSVEVEADPALHATTTPLRSESATVSARDWTSIELPTPVILLIEKLPQVVVPDAGGGSCETRHCCTPVTSHRVTPLPVLLCTQLIASSSPEHNVSSLLTESSVVVRASV